MVIHDEKPGARRASDTYTFLNVFGGLVTLMGIYRPLVVTILPFIGAFVTRVVGSIVEVIGKIGFKLFWKFANWYTPRKPNVHEFIAKSKERRMQ